MEKGEKRRRRKTGREGNYEKYGEQNWEKDEDEIYGNIFVNTCGQVERLTVTM